MVRVRKTPLPKKAKSDRLTMKGWAEGWREAFLNARLRRYTDALEAGHESEHVFLKTLYKEYFYYCPPSVADTEEPVLPAEPWEEDKIYAAESLTTEQMVAKRQRMKVLKKRIRGYLRYRAQKLWQIRSSVRHSVLDDGFAVLLGKLSGITKPPKARQAFQEWWTTKKEDISEQAKREHERICRDLEAKDVPMNSWPKWDVQFHSDFARKTFKAMSKEEQGEWGNIAKAEAAQAKEEYVKKMSSPPSKEPEIRAARIENMVSFLAPILEGIHELTGLHVVVSAAGPMPHQGGEHAVISAASGVNLEPEPVAATHWNSDPVSLPGGGIEERGYGAWRNHLLAWCSTAYSPSEVAASIVPGSVPTVPSTQQASARPQSSTIDLEREVLRRMEEDEGGDEEFMQEDDDSEKDSEEEEVFVPRKRGRQQDGGIAKKRATEKENAQPQDVHDDNDQELYDDNGRRLSQYELNRNANIRRNKELMATMFAGVEMPWQKAAREKEEAAAAAKKTAREKANTTRMEGKSAPQLPTRQSSRLSTISSQNETAATSIAVQDVTTEDETDQVIAHSVPGVTNQEVGFSRPPNAATQGEVSQAKESVAPCGSVEGHRGRNSEEAMTVGASVGALQPARTTTLTEDAGPTRILDESAPAQPRPTAVGPVVSSLSPEMQAAAEQSPDWFRLPYRHFKEAKLGKEWRKLLNTFVELEARGDFKVSSGSVQTRNRPKLLSDWTKKGRHSKKDEVLELPLTGITAFANVYAAWWDGMQPSWRTKGEAAWARNGYGDEWGLLEARGVLGWLSVVACLFWWGNAVTRGRKAKDREVWIEAVMDAEWMMAGVTAATS